MKKFNVAVVGATGMVGTTIRQVLEERDFPINKIYFLSSKKSAGEKLNFLGQEVIVEELREDSFENKDLDLALFSAGGAISEKYAALAVENGIRVIDNSSKFRMDQEVPLVVPEVNKEDLLSDRPIVANPNCSTIQSVVVLKPLEARYGIERIVYNTYQAVSGSGVKGVSDLKEGTNKAYPYKISKNCLPHIDDFLDNGYTKEEMKMVDETRKILGREDLRITATTVRVPIENCHAISINLELREDFELEDIRELFKNSPGIVLRDRIEDLVYPLAEEANGRDEVFVGRIRRDDSVKNGLNLWCVADNIRKGAATNTVQIAEAIIENL